MANVEIDLALSRLLWPFGLTMKFRPRKDVCVECGSKIPPGKAGRKCKDCRNVDSK